MVLVIAVLYHLRDELDCQYNANNTGDDTLYFPDQRGELLGSGCNSSGSSSMRFIHFNEYEYINNLQYYNLTHTYWHYFTWFSESDHIKAGKVMRCSSSSSSSLFPTATYKKVNTSL